MKQNYENSVESRTNHIVSLTHSFIVFVISTNRNLRFNGWKRFDCAEGYQFAQLQKCMIVPLLLLVLKNGL